MESTFQKLAEAWKNASITDRKKFVTCMKNPLQKVLDEGHSLDVALEVIAAQG